MAHRNRRIDVITPLLSPDQVLHQLPISSEISDHVSASCSAVEAICAGEDSRLLVIVGPCSIHDEAAAMEYAIKLKALSDELSDKLCIVMRVYFEKPRTTIGWKGLINDPYLDNSLAINDGLLLARKLLLQINELGLPAGTEFVDTITPQYLADLVSWAAIGARTTESQAHRMLASGLSMTIGFKNNTAGDIGVAVNAVTAGVSPHSFLSVTESGLGAIVETKGNESCHIILRGGQQGPNYMPEVVNTAVGMLEKSDLLGLLMIDCSHGNSEKDHNKQSIVIDSVCEQLQAPKQNIMGVMIESHLQAGNQKLSTTEEMVYGQSITDACISWEETEVVLRQLAAAVK